MKKIVAGLVGLIATLLLFPFGGVVQQLRGGVTRGEGSAEPSTDFRPDR
jgi:hypothetical protein